MPVGSEKGDKARNKIERTLNAAMFSLLWKQNFRKITVRDICEESVISRATFYARFTDKYNFLRSWLLALWPTAMVNEEDPYEVKEQKINSYIADNKTILKNLLLDADTWTMGVLFDVLDVILHVTCEKTIDGAPNPEYIVLSNFYFGGMIQYFMWQAKNDFPEHISPMNKHLYEIMKAIRE